MTDKKLFSRLSKVGSALSWISESVVWSGDGAMSWRFLKKGSTAFLKIFVQLLSWPCKEEIVCCALSNSKETVVFRDWRTCTYNRKHHKEDEVTSESSPPLLTFDVFECEGNESTIVRWGNTKFRKDETWWMNWNLDFRGRSPTEINVSLPVMISWWGKGNRVNQTLEDTNLIVTIIRNILWVKLLCGDYLS